MPGLQSQPGRGEPGFSKDLSREAVRAVVAARPARHTRRGVEAITVAQDGDGGLMMSTRIWCTEMRLGRGGGREV